MQLPLFSGRAQRPGASRARGPVGHCTSGRPLNPLICDCLKHCIAVNMNIIVNNCCTRWVNCISSCCRFPIAYSYSYSYRITLFNNVLRGIMQCRLVWKDGFSAWIGTVGDCVRWAEVRWKCVPDDWSRDGETSLADGRVCPRNEQVAAVSVRIVCQKLWKLLERRLKLLQQ